MDIFIVVKLIHTFDIFDDVVDVYRFRHITLFQKECEQKSFYYTKKYYLLLLLRYTFTDFHLYFFTNKK